MNKTDLTQTPWSVGDVITIEGKLNGTAVYIERAVITHIEPKRLMVDLYSSSGQYCYLSNISFRAGELNRVTPNITDRATATRMGVLV